MKKFLDAVLSPRLFAICYLPWLAINMTTVINVMDFTRYVLIAFAGWAVLIAAKIYFFSGKTPWLAKGQAVLLGFLAACLLSQGLQFSYGGFDAFGKLCYFAVCILVLYNQHGTDLAAYKQSFGIVARVMGIVIGGMMAVCDVMFVMLYSARITLRSGAAYLGVAENRLYGIFSSPNVCATYALILIWCSLMVLAWSKDMRAKVLWRVLAVIQLVLAVIAAPLTLSKGFYVISSVFFGVLVAVHLPQIKNYLCEKHERIKGLLVDRLARICLSVISVGLSVAVCLGGMMLVNTLAVHGVAWLYRNETSQTTQPEKPTQPTQPEEPVEDPEDPENPEEPPEDGAPQKDTGITVLDTDKQAVINNALLGFDGRVEAGRDDIDLTNKRSTIWTSHLALLKQEPLHLLVGVNRPKEYLTNNPAVAAGLSEAQISEIHRATGNMHCGYLQILVNHGVLAFLPMVAFLVWCAVLLIRFLIPLYRNRGELDETARDVFVWTIPFVAAILVNNLFETNFVLMGANFFQALFWFAAGACVLSMRKGAKKE